MPVTVPSVMFAMTVFFPGSPEGSVNAQSMANVASAVATSVATNASLVNISSVSYVLSFAVGLRSDVASVGTLSSSLQASLVQTAGAAGSSIALQIVSVNSTESGRRRTLLATATDAYTLFAFGGSLASVTNFNASLYDSVDSGQLAASLQAAGENVTSVELLLPAAMGVQFGVTVACPDDATGADGVALPTVTDMMQRVAPGVLDASSTLVEDLSVAGMGPVSFVAVTLTPIEGA